VPTTPDAVLGQRPLACIEVVRAHPMSIRAESGGGDDVVGRDVREVPEGERIRSLGRSIGAVDRRYGIGRGLVKALRRKHVRGGRVQETVAGRREGEGRQGAERGKSLDLSHKGSVPLETGGESERDLSHLR